MASSIVEPERAVTRSAQERINELLLEQLHACLHASTDPSEEVSTLLRTVVADTFFAYKNVRVSTSILDLVMAAAAWLPWQASKPSSNREALLEDAARRALYFFLELEDTPDLLQTIREAASGRTSRSLKPDRTPVVNQLHRFAGPARPGLEYMYDPSSRDQVHRHGNASLDACLPACSGTCTNLGASLALIPADVSAHAHALLLKALVRAMISNNNTSFKPILKDFETTRTINAHKVMEELEQANPPFPLPACFTISLNAPPPCTTFLFTGTSTPANFDHSVMQPSESLPLTQFNLLANCVLPRDTWTPCRFLFKCADIELQPPSRPTDPSLYHIWLTLQLYQDLLIEQYPLSPDANELFDTILAILSIERATFLADVTPLPLRTVQLLHMAIRTEAIDGTWGPYYSIENLVNERLGIAPDSQESQLPYMTSPLTALVLYGTQASFVEESREDSNGNIVNLNDEFLEIGASWLASILGQQDDMSRDFAKNDVFQVARELLMAPGARVVARGGSVIFMQIANLPRALELKRLIDDHPEVGDIIVSIVGCKLQNSNKPSPPLAFRCLVADAGPGVPLFITQNPNDLVKRPLLGDLVGICAFDISNIVDGPRFAICIKEAITLLCAQVWRIHRRFEVGFVSLQIALRLGEVLGGNGGEEWASRVAKIIGGAMNKGRMCIDDEYAMRALEAGEKRIVLICWDEELFKCAQKTVVEVMKRVQHREAPPPVPLFSTVLWDLDTEYPMSS